MIDFFLRDSDIGGIPNRGVCGTFQPGAKLKRQFHQTSRRLVERSCLVTAAA